MSLLMLRLPAIICIYKTSAHIFSAITFNRSEFLDSETQISIKTRFSSVDNTDEDYILRATEQRDVSSLNPDAQVFNPQEPEENQQMQLFTVMEEASLSGASLSGAGDPERQVSSESELEPHADAGSSAEESDSGSRI
ncbi:UNVERIFIED_CONTAM: hypothetical protein FKN15_028682 [Acipenser sinensis]